MAIFLALASIYMKTACLSKGLVVSTLTKLTIYTWLDYPIIEKWCFDQHMETLASSVLCFWKVSWYKPCLLLFWIMCSRLSKLNLDSHLTSWSSVSAWTAQISYICMTIPIVGLFWNFENLSLLVSSIFHPPIAISKTLVFHDLKQDATDAAAFIERSEERRVGKECA